MTATDTKEDHMTESYSIDVIPEEVRESLLGAPARAINKPEIGHLPDAIVDGFPVFDVGDKIVIERRSVVLAGRPYIDTKSYKVLKVDMSGGNVHLHDEDLDQFAMTNWRTATAAGCIFKFARGSGVVTKRKRGRPKKVVVEAPVAAAPPPTGPDGQPVKRGRGRPAGVKNRPKEVVAAEKAAKAKLRAAKAAKRAAKKAARG